MKWIRSNWTLLAVAAIFIAAAVVLVLAITNHYEPGFANPDNRWDHTPLLVGCSGYVPEHDEACETVEMVADTINHRLGYEQLVMTDGPDADIVWMLRAPVDVGEAVCGAPGECFQLTGSNGQYEQCAVQTMNASGPGDEEWLSIYHGFGHCLGLAHDDYERSIMRPVQRATPDRTLPPWFSDHDRQILRDRYMPR